VKLAPRSGARGLETQRGRHSLDQSEIPVRRSATHLLQAVIVVEATVDKNGNVVASKVTVASYQALGRHGPCVSESRVAIAGAASGPARARKPCIFRDLAGQNDSTFRVRTLTLPQE
jgi:hypothetical protein